MAELKGIDVAWARPTVAQIKAAGAHWVARYFSTDSGKNLNAGEVVSYQAAGLSIVTVWETTAGRATAGHQAGMDDARAAEVERKAVGLPASHVHYFAVDKDTSWASVQPYFDGVVSVLGWARVGCYGGYPVVVGAHGHGIRFLWQTVAWSGGRWASYASIRQTGGTLLGGSADVDYAEAADFGQTPRPITPKPAPAPKPVPIPVEEPDMIIVSVDQKPYPALKGWPGEFLLDGGHLSHIAHPADVTAFQAAGVKGPVTITVDQYNSLAAGK
jgi:hypothetical protein